MDTTEYSGDDITHKTEDCKFFDEVIGHIEDIIVGKKFRTMLDQFLAENCEHFEPTEENKLECMDVFNSYTALFDGFLQNELKSRMIGFDMEKFTNDLENNDVYRNSIDKGEIFELLQSFNNFQAFKEMMLDFRFQPEMDIDDIFMTTPLVLSEEMLDGPSTSNAQKIDNEIDETQMSMEQMQLDD